MATGKDRKSMLEKLKIAEPYNLFHNVIPEMPETLNEDNSISFRDLLCPSLGTLKCCLLITSKIHIKWLIKQFELQNLSAKPLTILYGEENPETEQYVDTYLPNVTQHCVTLENYHGSHHVKMGIFAYEDDSLRVAVFTANLNAHWDCFNHGIWVGPLCPKLSENSKSGESPTNFRSDLLTYLQAYNLPCLLNGWIENIARSDFSDVRVCLVTSYPGLHGPNQMGSHIQYVSYLLKEHCDLSWAEESRWPVVIQTSCIGRFGKDPTHPWFRTFLKCLTCHKKSEGSPVFEALKMIYPTYSQVMNGHFRETIGQGMRYLESLHNEQSWIEQYLHRWKFDSFNRTKIMTHVKSYCRLSPCGSKMAWFLMTFSNATRGAWGTERGAGKTYMGNFEVGVMFFPKFFNEESFKIKTCDHNIGEALFPMFYDLPLIKYEVGDQPWTNLEMDVFKQKCVKRKPWKRF